MLPGVEGDHPDHEEANDAVSEEKSMRAALSVQSSQAANIAILERARNTFDMIRDALLLRVAGGLPPGPLHELPVPVIAALATAQGHQNTALALCVQSAQDDCAAGGLRGTTLADLLYDEAMYDATAAELIQPDISSRDVHCGAPCVRYTARRDMRAPHTRAPQLRDIPG